MALTLETAIRAVVPDVSEDELLDIARTLLAQGKPEAMPSEIEAAAKAVRERAGGDRPILLPDVHSFGDLFDYVGEWQRTENHERHNAANGEPRHIGKNEIGPFATVNLRQIGGEQHRSIAVRASDAVLEAVAPRIVTEDDSLSFHLIAHRDGRCLVVLDHGYIIGSHWLAYIDPATIPVLRRVRDIVKGDRALIDGEWREVEAGGSWPESPNTVELTTEPHSEGFVFEPSRSLPVVPKEQS